MELVDKRESKKVEYWMTNGSKRLKSLFMEWHNPPWKSLTNMVSGIESDPPRKHNAWNGAQERWIYEDVCIDQKFDQPKKEKSRAAQNFSRQQIPLALETNATINSLHLTNISHTWCTSYNSRLVWNDPVYTIADFPITRYQTFLSSPYKNICQQKIPEAIVFIKLSGGSIFCDSNPSQLQNILDVIVSSPCVGWIWSDRTIPQCICCTTKACVPWIDECNWLEPVVQSCGQGICADMPHKKEVQLQQILQNRHEGNGRSRNSRHMKTACRLHYLLSVVTVTEILCLKCTRVVSFEKGKKSQPGHTITRQARIPARSPFVWKTTNDNH
jgi:hypothetical protein